MTFLLTSTAAVAATVFNENADIYFSLKHIICSLNVVERLTVHLVYVVITLRRDTRAFIIRRERNVSRNIMKVLGVKLFKRSQASKTMKSLSVYRAQNNSNK